MNINVFLFIFISYSFVQSEKIITLEYYEVISGRPNPKLRLNNEHFNLPITFNTFLPYSFFGDEFKYVIEEHKGESLLLTHEFQYQAYKYYTSITIDSITLPHFNMYISDDYISLFADEGLSLSYKYLNDSFSIVHSLYNNYNIDKIQFCLEHNENKGIGKLYFGGVPNNTHLSLPYKGKVNINSKQDKWSFTLENVSYKDKTFEKKMNAVIHSGVYAMMFSDKIFHFITDEIFKDKILDKTCSIKPNKDDGDTLLCDSIDITQSTDNIITFSFDTMTIHLTYKDLFENKKLLIRTNPFSQYSSYELILGVKFLTMFKYSLFDYEANQVSFYSDVIHIESLSNCNLIEVFCLIIIILCFLSIICSIYIKYYKLN